MRFTQLPLWQDLHWLHVFVHEPQWFSSVLMLRHTPLQQRSLAVQFLLAALHEPQKFSSACRFLQAPAQHVFPDAQLFPHEPQFASSD